MSRMTNYMENKLADFIRGQGLTLPADWHAALGSAASDSSFTELSGTAYARQAIPRSLTDWAGTQGAGSTVASSGTSHATSNNNAVSWGTPGSNWGVASYVGLFDASTSGNCWMVIPISSVTITTGNPDPVQIAAGVLQMALGLTGGLTDAGANSLIDLIFRDETFTWPATLYMALFTTAPTNAGGGVEVSGGSYARASLVPSLANISGTQAPGSTAASSGTGGRVSNNADVAHPPPTADWGIAVAAGVLDASTSGELLFWRSLTIAVSIVDDGPAPTYAADSIGLTFA